MPEPKLVLDNPTPPKLEACPQYLQVLFADNLIAETRQGYWLLKPGAAPKYFFPPDDVLIKHLTLEPGLHKTSPWLGKISFYKITLGKITTSMAAWSCLRPPKTYGQIRGFLGFTPSKTTVCRIDGEPVLLTEQKQPEDWPVGWSTKYNFGQF